MDQPRLVEPGIAPRDLGEDRPDQRHVGEIGDREQPGAQAVVDVVVVVGDVVGQRGDLRLGPGKGVRSSRMRRSYSAIERRTVAGRGKRTAAAGRCA